MKRFIWCAAVFAAGLGAQSFDPFQAPQGRELFFQAFQSPQVFELKGGTMAGGTYLGVNLAEIGNERAKELKLREPAGVGTTRPGEGSSAETAVIETPNRGIG